MNKVSFVLGVAAVATLSGCKDPNYVRADKSQDEVKTVQMKEEQPQEDILDVQLPPAVKDETPPEPHQLSQVVEDKTPEMKKPVEQETTVYIVQPGDYLSKISKKYNVKIATIKELNGLKSDVIKVGQKLKLPGKIEIGEQKTPVVAKKSQPPKAKKPYKPYEGPTKEYVAVSGDFLGKIAAKNSISVRQLKDLNQLTSDKVKVGQKFKVPDSQAKNEMKKEVVASSGSVSETQNNATVEPVVENQVKPEDTPIPLGNAEESVDADVSAAATPAQQVQESTRTYVVKEGETINDICAFYGLVPDTIRDLNNLGDNDNLIAGQVIKIPASAQE
jgi:LysM repeat protein